MKQLKEFFNEERKRVFTPDPYFVQRVMARLNAKVEQEAGIWDMIPVSSRPVLAFALILVLCFVALDLFVPVMPQRGIVDAFLESEQGPVESRLLSGTESADQEFVMEELIALEVDR